MDALSVLEPRVAGEELLDPDVEFGGVAGDLHMVCDCLPGTTYLTNPPRTSYCEDATKLC